MPHQIYKVNAFQVAGQHLLRLRFDDHSEQTNDFKPVLAGELYRP